MPRNQRRPSKEQQSRAQQRIRSTVGANRVAGALRRFSGGDNINVRTSNGNRTVANWKGTATFTRAGQKVASAINRARAGAKPTGVIRRGNLPQTEVKGELRNPRYTIKRSGS